MRDIIALVVLVIPWLMGIVLAKGTWSTMFSIFVIPYAWYLVAEHYMK